MRPTALLLTVACAADLPAPHADAPDDPAPDSAADRACRTAADCDDGNPCTGEEACDPDGVCVAGQPVVCDAPTTCVVEADEAVCAVLCALPVAPVLDVVRPDDALVFAGELVQTAVMGIDEVAPVWRDASTVDLTGWLGPVRVLARSLADGCAPDDVFDHVYDVRPTYPGAVGAPDDVSVAADDPRIVGWATGVAEVVYGEAVDAAWRTPDEALGPALGGPSDVLVLGRGGAATLTFEPPLADGPGPDLVVFENAFSDTFLELGFVEVSSDGVTFARFDSAARTPGPVDAFGAVAAADVHGLAGKHRFGFGTPFDLAWLRFHPAVRAGHVDLASVTAVRVVDVVGDGSARDAFGRVIYDPYPTVGTAGFDLDAVGALHVAAP